MLMAMASCKWVDQKIIIPVYIIIASAPPPPLNFTVPLTKKTQFYTLKIHLYPQQHSFSTLYLIHYVALII